MPRDCQIVLFSATFADIVRQFAVRFAPKANEISLKREELSVDGIKQLYMDCNNEQHKYEVLCNLYDLLTIGQSIIFCRVSVTVSIVTSSPLHPFILTSLLCNRLVPPPMRLPDV
jgi:ATP-dependent RNA helicase DDX19/DBP5